MARRLTGAGLEGAAGGVGVVPLDSVDLRVRDVRRTVRPFKSTPVESGVAVGVIEEMDKSLFSISLLESGAV